MTVRAPLLINHRPFTLCRLLILAAVWLPSTSIGTIAWSADGDAVPSWRKGVSRWNGSGYDLPEHVQLPQQIPAASPSSGSPSGASAYTIPTAPSSEPRRNPYLALPEVDASPRLSQPLNAAGPELKTTSSSPASQSQRSETLPGAGESDATDSVSEDPTGEAFANKKQATAVDDLAVTEDVTTKSAADSEDAGTKIEQELQSSVEAPPLQSEVIRWYQYPIRWMRGWNSHAEIGIDGSDGNATTLALQTGIELKRQTDRYSLAIDADYRQVSNRQVTTEDNGRLNIDYDRLVASSSWSGFAKTGLEWDKFKAFDLRVNVNGGVGYHWIRNDDASLVTRFGAGASQEIGAPNDDWIAEAVFGIEAERQLTPRQKLKGKVDYFPAWEDFGNYRLVSDVAWEILLDGTENLSLKLAATDRYDSTPQGFKPNDVYYSLLLLYKF